MMNHLNLIKSWINECGVLTKPQARWKWQYEVEVFWNIEEDLYLFIRMEEWYYEPMGESISQIKYDWEHLAEVTAIMNYLRSLRQQGISNLYIYI